MSNDVWSVVHCVSKIFGDSSSEQVVFGFLAISSTSFCLQLAFGILHYANYPSLKIEMGDL